MTTKRKAKVLSRTAPLAGTAVPQRRPSEPVINIPTEMIELSPLNYRKAYDLEELERFAGELVQDGILSSLVVRPGKDGLYELVVGERRLLASRIGHIAEVPAQVRNLTDLEVIELQLAENLQREDPHPLYTAHAITSLLNSGQNMEQVADRLGKPKKLIYKHMKLAMLILPIQQIFLAAKISLKQAFEIAAIDESSQQEFFDAHCQDWEDEHFVINNLSGKLSRYRYDLKKATFDTTDELLVPTAGACSNCPFNSAVMQSLFPELSQEAVCTSISCFQHKCQAHLDKQLAASFEHWQPVAIIIRDSSPYINRAISGHPLAKTLPILDASEITVYIEPEEPKKEDYFDRWPEEGEEPEFYQDDYDQALAEFADETETYQQLLKSGNLPRALIMDEDSVGMVLYDLTKRSTGNSSGPQTSKQVQEAIKSGEVTEDMLRGEINRLNHKEGRSKELDREKVQLKVHEMIYEKQLDLPELVTSPVDADLLACRLLALNGMDWSGQCRIKKLLFDDAHPDDDQILAKLAQLDEHEHALLIRTAVASKPEGKRPESAYGKVLYLIAAQTGLDVQAIEDQQAEAVHKREGRLRERLEEMQRRIAKLSAIANNVV